MDYQARIYLAQATSLIMQTYDVPTPIKDIDAVVAKMHGKIIEVAEYPVSNTVVKGDGDCDFIIRVLQGQRKDRRNICIAQSLGTLFLHTGYMSDWMRWDNLESAPIQKSTYQLDFEKDEFAYNFLTPREQFAAYIREHTINGKIDTVQVAQYFGVPKEIAIKRGKWIGTMAITNDVRPVITELDALVRQIQQTHTRKIDYMPPTAIFFISFDIVSSTAYKASHPDTWSSTMKGILRHIISTIEISPLGGYAFWKSLGDEIVYTKEIVRISDLPLMLDEIYAKLDYLNKLIADGAFCNKEDGKILGIKATAWVCDVSSSSQYTRNVFTQYAIRDNRKQMDFAGPDIDTGFRASKYSTKNRLVISWGLSFLLWKALSPTEFATKVNVTSFKVLDGIWENFPYPIVLYHANSNISFANSIVGCDSEKEQHLRDYLTGITKKVTANFAPYHSYAEKIILEIGKRPHLIQRMENLMAIIEGTNGTQFVELVHCDNK